VRRGSLAVALGLVLVIRAGHAQLLSPGKLSRPHASLEGVAQCSACHELGKRGVDDARCLSCHEPLARRVAQRKGFHATLRALPCAQCHKDHFGADFRLVRLDTAGFDHDTTGFVLALSHDTVPCRSCHNAERLTEPVTRAYAERHGVAGRTFLGLGTTCLDCHRSDDPHGVQFRDRRCADCHDESAWRRTPGFRHERTRYALTGRHQDLACGDCHEPTVAGQARTAQYVGLEYHRCAACHADPHRGAMRGSCESCHSTGGWQSLDRNRFEATFDHATTRFPLVAAHARARCNACHQPRATRDPTVRIRWAGGTPTAAYRRPVATDCLSCHVDSHQGSFARTPGGIACGNCHSQEEWYPTTYDLARHNRETYPLTGGHAAVPCSACHQPPTSGPRAAPVFRLPKHECVDCHAADDPHEDQFGDRPCTDCHVTEAFRISAFDHARTRYPLDGAHRDVPCIKCHVSQATTQGTVVRYRPLSTDCRSCHDAG
jgi:hypothetical protein